MLAIKSPSNPRSVPVCLPAAKAKATDQQRREALTLAEKYEAKLYARIVAAFAAMSEQVDESDLIDAIRKGRGAVDEYFASAKFDAAFAKVLDNNNALFAETGIETATYAASGDMGASLVAVFDSAHPRAAALMRANNLRLISLVTRQQRRTIQAVLVDALQTGKTTMQSARAIHDSIGLTERDAATVVRYRGFLESGDWSAALNRDLGGNAARSVAAARRGTITLTQEKIDGLVRNYSERLRRNRAGTIAATESFKTYNQAANEAWQQIFDQNPLIPLSDYKRFWVATLDRRTRPDHVLLPELNKDGVAMDKPFLLPGGRTIAMPHDPAAPASETINCRCTQVVRLRDSFIDRFLQADEFKPKPNQGKP